MGKVFDDKKDAEEQQDGSLGYDDCYDDNEWGIDYDWELVRGAHEALLEQVRTCQIPVTPELLQSVTDPEWKRELIEAICLSKVHQPKEK